MSNGPSRMSRTRTTPVPVQRTTRLHDLRVLTSLPAGKMVPLAAVPLLREDSVTSGQVRINFEMAETVEVLMNAINVRVMAYHVPKLAMERFSGMDELNRSYKGIPNQEGGPVTPWFETAAVGPVVPEYLRYMGKHVREGQLVNLDYSEAYNAIWNFRAKNRSPDITLRTRYNPDLAPAFWLHENFAHIVPDFDQAVIDGEVALNVVNSRMPIRGLAMGTAGAPAAQSGYDTEGNAVTYPSSWAVEGVGSPVGAGEAHMVVKSRANGSGINVPEVFAEMQENGITVSLSNIELARKTQAFARLRQQYSGHSDEYIIDLLMDGISVPEQYWRQPQLLADQRTVFGMSKRYASDAGNLTESVVNGATFIDLRWSLPRCPTGGIIMIVAEITPEQLFERQRDPYLHAIDVGELPEFLRDTLDPEKVSVVPCEYVDIDHDTPNATFGYAPLNHEWTNTSPQIGGRFHRPKVDAGFDEDRQRIWAVETQNPTLSEDFYLCTSMHLKPFVVQNQDPFDALMRGSVLIRGNTVFGGALIEATNDYAEIAAKAPTDRIEKPA